MTAVIPTITNYSVPVQRFSATIISATLADTRWPVMSELALTCPSISLPAGRWQITTHISSMPGVTAGPSVSNASDTTLGSPGNIAVPTLQFDVLRALDSSHATATAAIDIQQWDGTRWRSYARGQFALDIPPAPASTAANHYGSTVQILSDVTTGTTLPHGDAVQLRPYLDALVAAGADTVRTSTAWLYMQPSGASFDAGLAATLDTFMADCASRGLKVITQIGAPPAWTGGLTSTTPSLANIDQFVDAYLARWHPYAIEFDNEPNTGFYYHYGTAVPAADQVRVLQRVYTRAKAATTPPLVGGSSLAYGDVAYLQQMYNAGLHGYVDYISIHPYEIRGTDLFTMDNSWQIGDPQQPWEHDDTGNAFGNSGHGPGKWVQAVHAIYRTMRANNDAALPIWVTEGGWSTSLLISQPGLRCSDAQQATYLAYGLRQLARCPMVETVLTYTTYDSPNPLTTWNGWGMVRIGGEQKPSFNAWRDTVAGIKAGTL